jgi:hypothetical protein
MSHLHLLDHIGDNRQKRGLAVLDREVGFVEGVLERFFWNL